MLLFLITSCKVQKFNLEKETLNILNLTLTEYNESICLEKNTFYGHSRVEPNYLINHYQRVYNSSQKSAAYTLFYKEIYGVITNKELKELKERDFKWQKREWNISKVFEQKVVLITNSITKSSCQDKKVLKISEPVFTSDKNKAMVLITTSKNNTGSTFLKILKKEKGKWNIIGGVPIGTGG